MKSKKKNIEINKKSKKKLHNMNSSVDEEEVVTNAEKIYNGIMKEPEEKTRKDYVKDTLSKQEYIILIEFIKKKRGRLSLSKYNKRL